ncbi:sigma-70 family RNA polymerase sigma factor [bacterium 1xD42-67]|nr:sigma-70 family RNA polymerase sigma factor [bacterium 1xD42-67]
MDTIIDRYQNTVYGLALARTGSRADADDVFQEVFLAYFQSGKTFRDEEHRKAWLLRTTINQSRRVTSSSWWQRTVPLSEREDVPVQFRDPEENEVWTALQSLAEDYRLPLYLFYFQELSTQEIAKALAIRPGAVRMRLTRGREQLRKILKGAYFDET